MYVTSPFIMMLLLFTTETEGNFPKLCGMFQVVAGPIWSYTNVLSARPDDSVKYEKREKPNY